MNTGSFGTIFIQRNIPVIDGYVRTTPNYAKSRTKVSIAQALDVPGTSLICLTPTPGASKAGSKYGGQELLRLPPVQAQSSVDVAYNKIIQQTTDYDCQAISLPYNMQSTVYFDPVYDTWISFLPTSHLIDVLIGAPATFEIFYGNCHALKPLAPSQLGDSGVFINATSLSPLPRIYVKISGVSGDQLVTLEDD
jgi:hypothetical protein